MIIEWINRLVKADPVIDELFLKSQHTRTFMLTGFVKSTTGTALISMGIGLLAMKLFEALINNYPQYFYFTAVLSVVAGLAVYFIGDLYEISKNKEEKRTQDEYYVDMFNDMAHKMISQADMKRDEEIRQKIQELRDMINK